MHEMENYSVLDFVINFFLVLCNYCLEIGLLVTAWLSCLLWFVYLVVYVLSALVCVRFVCPGVYTFCLLWFVYFCLLWFVYFCLLWFVYVLSALVCICFVCSGLCTLNLFWD